MKNYGYKKIMKGCGGCLAIFTVLFLAIIIFTPDDTKKAFHKGREMGLHMKEESKKPLKDKQLGENLAYIENRVNVLIAEHNVEAVIWKDGDTSDDLNPPFEVIVNFSINNAYSCDNAKRASYEILATLYTDKIISSNTERILITVPNNLRVSLGSTDGTKMAQNETFTGSTNFWKMMEQYKIYEDESGNIEDRTWGRYLENCIE